MDRRVARPDMPDDGVNGYNTALVTELLRHKRKARDVKSCFPCRHRKVRCDGGLPCSNCVKRDHVSLCRRVTATTPRPSSVTKSAATDGPSVAPSSPRSVGGDPYGGAGGAFDPTTNGQFSSGFPPPPLETASPNPQLRDNYLPPLAQGHPPQPQDDHDDTILQRLETIERQIQSLKSDLVQRRSNRAYPHRDTSDLLPRLDSLVATPTTTTYGNSSNNHSRIPSSISQLESAPLSRGKHFVEEATGATIFLGKRADPPLSLGCFRDPAPLLSLGGDVALNGSGGGGASRHHQVQLTPRTYPFANLWTPEAKLGDVCRTLPCPTDIIRYWQAFEAFVYPFYPLLVALDDFRASIYAFLSRQPMMSRAQQQQQQQAAEGHGNGNGGSTTSQWIDENADPSWLALLFSVLACGTQFSSDTAQERYLRSKVFVCSAFQCLRTANLFFKTDLNQIQAMALIGHCLRNNLETNSAWILLGVTIRLAQSVGLHEASMPGSQGAWASEVHRTQAAHLWRMIIWQDTFLSFTYDRPPTATSTILHNDVFGASHRHLSNKHGQQHPDHPTQRSFTEAVFRVSLIILDWTRQGTATAFQSPSVQFDTADKDHRRYSQIRSLLSFKRQFDLMMADSAPHLGDDSHCDTLQKHLERLGLQIHVASALCRMYRLCVDTLREDRQQQGQQQGYQGYHDHHHHEEGGQDVEEEEKQLTNEYAMHATEAVEGFLDMYQLSPIVCRSWPFVHNAVSSAVMLWEFLTGGGGGGGSSSTPGSTGQGGQGGMQALREEWTRRSEPLIIKLIGVLEKEERESEWLDADTNVRHSGPHSRALRALKESYGR
ncbi:hypothetical protein QBC32DRAFT_135921 [Pseudoneurospora amorphoporcata]|uniref:Zn(2)-C6 fungal-type domain-containing protein n=1 Tax=Pseudoneurospora amorphoporcata TaxID=241081 RepID=A0AAN6NVK0_9PEZI|nr:hypothetical protein QBC32DRAFT_135921 [Pseudoneurospora amorphoporcata]